MFHDVRPAALVLLWLSTFTPPLAAAPAPDAPALLIGVYPASDEAVLRDHGAAIWERDEQHVIAAAPAAAVERLAALDIAPLFSAPDRGEGIYLLSHDEFFAPPALPGLRRFILSESSALYLLPPGLQMELPRLKFHGMFRGVPRVPLDPVRMHAADAAALLAPPRPQAPNPLVQTIVNATSQASWFQFVRDLSGDSDVTIPGFCTNCRIRTRASDYMFPPRNMGTPLGNPFATEYLEMKAAGWGFGGANTARESYTSALSGCTSQQGAQTWQNVVFTLPGQVDYAQNQQVIFLVHYDTISESAANDANNAPGADDAISGGTALLEAMRLFKDYGWKYPVKFLFTSGEEVGICGTTAYTRQHGMAPVWRVVNMDQTAFDGNKNGLMNLYNWSVAACPGCVAFGDAFVQANADYGNIIAPAKIVRNQTKMCQTDHCPFWNAGAVAIDFNEDLTNNDICPCFDSSQTASCRDTVTQFYPLASTTLMFDQNFSWPTQKAAIALIAHTAEPLYACPAAGVTMSAAGSAGQVALSWGAVPPVTNYVIERAAGGCGGAFTGITQVASPGYTDTAISNGLTYGYRIRTCPFQVSNCIAVTPGGPSVNYQAGSAVITADSGDADINPDNCELSTARITLVNDGNAALSNVRLAALSADSPAVQVASPIPYSIGALAVGASVQVPFKFYLGRSGTSATCQQAFTFTVTLTSDQTTPRVRSFALTGEQSPITGTLTYGFETAGNLEGWTLSSNNAYTQNAGGAAGSTANSLHITHTTSTFGGRAICSGVYSPEFTPAASSTVTAWIDFGIGASDRASLRAVNSATGARTLLVPNAGVLYSAASADTTLCEGQSGTMGWSGDTLTTKTWRSTTSPLAALAGTPLRLEMRYSTSSLWLAHGSQGFWFDNVQITNATVPGCDAQSNSCAALPAEVSPAAGPVPFTLGKSGGNNTLRFSEVTGATSYHVYGGTLSSLLSGVYNHGALTGLCSLTDGTLGDGQVTATTPAANLPGNNYFLAVAKGAAGESPYGFNSAGAAIPLALNNCP